MCSTTCTTTPLRANQTTATILLQKISRVILVRFFHPKPDGLFRMLTMNFVLIFVSIRNKPTFWGAKFWRTLLPKSFAMFNLNYYCPLNRKVVSPTPWYAEIGLTICMRQAPILDLCAFWRRFRGFGKLIDRLDKEQYRSRPILLTILSPEP